MSHITNKDELYTSITTTETGPDLLTLPYGTYTMKQQNTTEGYKMLDDIEINIMGFTLRIQEL